MPTHSRQATVAYAIAAVPAVFLPLSFAIMVVWVLGMLLPELLSGKDPHDPNGFVFGIVLAGYYGTLIQWPFYLLWAAFTSRLTSRVRILWIGVLILLNMFAIPWFLFSMYRGTAQVSLTRCITRKSVRSFFERGNGRETHVD